MGAADMVPGVSGGTIALITGIYERLVTAIAEINPRILPLLFSVRTSTGRARIRTTLVRKDIHFLFVLGAGIGTAVLALSRPIDAAFETFPAVMSAFFFALMASSAVIIYQNNTPETLSHYAIGVVGIVLSFVLSGVTSSSGGGNLFVTFVAGAIAISAMVLPGISGAAFLYLLGQYQYLLSALTEFTDSIIGFLFGGGTDSVIGPGIVVTTFMTGAVFGLLTMARIVNWALTRYRVGSLAFLVGLMIGALRLPVEEAVRETSEWSPELVGAMILAAGIGSIIILGLDRYTGSLKYS